MANEHYNIYGGNPTAGAVDGTITSNGNGMSPLTFDLDAAAAESKTQKAAIRMEAGYTGKVGTVITATGVNASLWSFCETENGTFADSITLSGGLDSVNTVFYVKAKSNTTEKPGRDTSTKIDAQVYVQLAD